MTFKEVIALLRKKPKSRGILVSPFSFSTLGCANIELILDEEGNVVLKGKPISFGSDVLFESNKWYVTEPDKPCRFIIEHRVKLLSGDICYSTILEKLKSVLEKEGFEIIQVGCWSTD